MTPPPEATRGRAGAAGAPVITGIAVERNVVPLPRPWGPTVNEVTVLAVRVDDADGGRGHGFSWTPSIGGRAVAAVIEDDLAPWAIGRPADPGAVWLPAWEHLHEAGGGGITTIALAGLDLALWDLRCRRAGAGLDDLLGRRHPSQPTYGSGVNLHYDLPDLLAQVRRWVDAGHGAVKIKVGRPDLAEDLDRVAAVREVLGRDRGLMLDANQRWDLDRATRSIEALAAFEPVWMEEPLRADDTGAHVELRRRSPVPIAVGENVNTLHRFRDLLDLGACDVVQPNVVRVGGVTPFLAIASLATERGVELAPHLLTEISARLAVTLPATTWVEDVEDAGFDRLGVLARPSGVTIDDGRARVAATVGTGIELTWNGDHP